MGYYGEALAGAWGLITGLDREVYTIVGTSLRISLTAVALAALIAVPLGAVCGVRSFRGKRLLRHLLNTLMAIPTVVVGLLLYGLLTRHGPLGGWELLYTPAAIVIGECLLILPIVWNLSLTAVEATDPRLQATCRALGASEAQRLWLTLREARGGLVAAIAAGFGRAIGEVGVAMILGGNIAGLTRTMTTAIALETAKGEFELGLALGMLLLAFAFAVNAAVQLLGTARA